MDAGLAASYEESSALAMGPSLLAQQPVMPRKSKQQVTLEWSTAYAKLEARLGMLRSWRWSWWQYWSSLAAFFNPRRYLWVIVPNKMWRGNPINDQIIDSTGLQAVRTCAAGMWTGLTSPSRPWFALEIALPQNQLDAEGKAWIEDTQEKAYAVLAQSNFYTIMAQAFEDVTVFGTAPVIMYEDFEDVIRCYLPAAGEYYLGVGPRLSTDTLYREFTYTVAQIIARWQVEAVPEVVASLWRQGGGSLDTEFVIVHAIEPNFAFNDQSGNELRLIPAEFTWREVYWLKGMRSEQPLEKNGFRSAPFFAARWSTVSNDAYGRSPCMDALGDNKQVQLETRRKAEFIEKGVRPPMGANPEMKNEPSSIVPGNVTYMDTSGGKKGFFPLFEPNYGWLPALTNDIAMVNARIEKCLFVDLFMAITRMAGVQPRNELELSQRNQERLQELGPFVHLFENEFAGPALRRVIDIMIRRRLLRPLPESLRGVPFKITYLSIMRQAQRAMEAVSMKDVLAFGGLASNAARNAGLPDPLRNLNMDKFFRRYGEVTDIPEDTWFTLDEVAEHDKAREDAKAAAAAPANAMAGVTAAKALSETQLVQPSALSALVGGVGAPA